MSVPRKHHYLPQFYLDGFKILPQRGKKPHIWQVDKANDNKAFNSSIANTGCIRDFHTLDHEDSDPDHKSIESILSKIEGIQNQLIQRITKERRIDELKVGEAAEFVSLMRFRVPAFARQAEAQLKSVVLDSYKLMLQSGELSNPPEHLRKSFEKHGIDKIINIEISNWKIVQKMMEMGFAPESIGALSQLNYQLLVAEEPNSFLTSDNPVALYHPNYEQIKPYGVGPAIRGTEVSIPLSSQLLLVAGSELEPGTYAANRGQVDEFNRRVVVMAENYVFCSELNDDVNKLVNKNKRIFAGFQFENLFHGDGSVHILRFIPVE